MAKYFRRSDFMYLIAIVVFDLAIYIVLGLFMMGYDDTYDVSKGEYWSFSGMNNQEKFIYIFFNVWNVLNIIGAVYLVYRIVERVKSGR